MRLALREMSVAREGFGGGGPVRGPVGGGPASGRSRCSGGDRTAWRPAGGRSPTAFTLVELLVVIVVVGLLIAGLVTITGHVASSQKRAATKVLFQILQQATDEFAATDPLRHYYNTRQPSERKTPGFGSYPPYQLANPNNAVATAVHDKYLSGGNPVAFNPATLAQRVARDLSGSTNTAGWVDLVGQADGANSKSHLDDDNRALSLYLRLYAPGAFARIPQERLLRLPPGNQADFVNPRGSGTAPGSVGLVDVFGIYDGWGVPIDYFLYAKMEWDALSGLWFVSDRQPVFMSRGISREVYDAQLARYNGPADMSVFGETMGNWIFSVPMPSPAIPASEVTNTGGMPLSGGPGGWVRVRGAFDPVGYLPAYDGQ
ncbi:hypothetical protein RAS1_29280 [Phycisphaerae bacterium RAS1]|nr:hypothetical protein RAS1_29280 [Phycisphaerae bacterium RAS1]